MSTKRTLSDLLRDTHLGPSAGAHLARALVNMGVRYPTAFSTTIAGSPPASGAETVVCISAPLTIPLDFAQVLLFWYVSLTTGAGTTSLTWRLRPGTTLTGATINQAFGFVVTAATQTQASGCYVHTPGAVAGQQYALTLQGTGTTGAMSVNDVCLLALAL